MSRRLWTVLPTAVLILPLAACGGGQEAATTARSTVTITSSLSTPPPSTTTVTTQEPAPTSEVETPQPVGTQRFSGTIRVLTIDELQAIHQEDPLSVAAAKDARFVVLVLDSPRQAEVMYPYEEETRPTEVSMILIAQDYRFDAGRVAPYESLDGSRQTMLVSAENLIFPGDPRPPRAEPFATNFELEG